MEAFRQIMMEYRYVRLVGKGSQLKLYPPFDRNPMKLVRT